MSDSLMERLAALPLGAPDAARAERTRVRCRARLASRTPAVEATSDVRVMPGLWRPAAAVIGTLYMLAAVALALEVYGGR